MTWQKPETRYIRNIRTDIPLTGTNLVFVADDINRNQFVVKPHLPQCHRWAAPNELLTALLGKAIGGPFLEPYLVELDEDVIEASEIKNKFRLRFDIQFLGPGIGFSVPYFRYRKEGSLMDNNITRVRNPEQAIPLLITDCWLQNIDRNNRGNLFFVVDEKPISKQDTTMYAIDHELIFGGDSWDSAELAKPKNYTKVQVTDHLPILRDLAWLPGYQKQLECSLKKAEQITKNQLEWIFEQIPEVWEITSAEKQAALNYIRNRQPLVRNGLRSYFCL